MPDVIGAHVTPEMRMREELLEYLCEPTEDARGGPLELHAFVRRDQRVVDGVLVGSSGWWWIAGGIPRMLPPTEYRNKALEARYSIELRRLGLARPTSNERIAPHPKGSREALDRYGELRRLRSWGFLSESDAFAHSSGGLWRDTRAKFDEVLPDSIEGKTCVDLGCGNGRFMAAALERGAARVIGVDTGWDIEPLMERFAGDDRVHVVDARIDRLPVAGADAVYAIGALGFTAEPRRAFGLAVSACRPGGLIAIEGRARGTASVEIRDRALRGLSTRLTRGGQVRFARWMSGRIGPAAIKDSLEWWSAPFAWTLSPAEVGAWAAEDNCQTLHCEAVEGRMLAVFRREAGSILENKPVRASKAA